MDIKETAVHMAHCCVLHGCKYGEPLCPVETGENKQYNPCVDCYDMVVDTPDYGSHPTHCCVMHGCKYGDEECPVEKGKAQQEYPCEFCVDVKETEEEIARLQAEIAFVKKLNNILKKTKEKNKDKVRYIVRHVTRSERVLKELLEEHRHDPRHDCEQCGGNFIIADTPEHPFYNDRAYAKNSVNTVKEQANAFNEEIRGDDSLHWICNECQRSNMNEI